MISENMSDLLGKVDETSMLMGVAINDAIRGLIWEDAGHAKDLASQVLINQLELILEDVARTLADRTDAKR